jgi:hypothetical protein
MVAENEGRIFRSTELRGFPFFRVVYNKPGLSTTDCYGSRDELRLGLAKRSVTLNRRVIHCLTVECREFNSRFARSWFAWRSPPCSVISEKGDASLFRDAAPISPGKGDASLFRDAAPISPSDTPSSDLDRLDPIGENSLIERQRGTP